jgi:hypothetical protein
MAAGRWEGWRCRGTQRSSGEATRLAAAIGKAGAAGVAVRHCELLYFALADCTLTPANPGLPRPPATPLAGQENQWKAMKKPRAMAHHAEQFKMLFTASRAHCRARRKLPNNRQSQRRCDRGESVAAESPFTRDSFTSAAIIIAFIVFRHRVARLPRVPVLEDCHLQCRVAILLHHQ